MTSQWWLLITNTLVTHFSRQDFRRSGPSADQEHRPRRPKRLPVDPLHRLRRRHRLARGPRRLARRHGRLRSRLPGDVLQLTLAWRCHYKPLSVH